MLAVVTPVRQLFDLTRNNLHQTMREFLKFGVIGLINTVVDIGLWNLLNAVTTNAEVKTKIAATCVATASAYLLNRHWAFRHRKRQQLRRETLLFLFFNAIGLCIQAGAIVVAKYGFDTTDTVALNIVNLGSIGLGMLFRFWSYRRWVWLSDDGADTEPSTEPATVEPATGKEETSEGAAASNDTATQLEATSAGIDGGLVRN